jgi:hypothetical protein
MAEKVEIDIEVNSNIEPSLKQLRELKKQLKETAAGSADFKRLSAQIRDVEDAIEGAKLGADDFAGALEAAPGPVGKLFQAIKKVEIATKSWGAALKATGIGLIVAAVGGLVAAFTQTEGSLKKLEPLLIGLEKIFGGIVEAFQPVLDAFLEMALQALPYITDGIKIFYSSLFALFTLVKEAGAGVGKVLKGVFTLDIKSIEEGFTQLSGSWSKTVDSYNATSERFEEGSKKITKTQKKNAEDQKAIADKLLQDKLKNLDAEQKAKEGLLSKEKAIAMQSAFNEEQKLAVEQEFAKKSYDLQIDLINKKLALYKKDSAEWKTLQGDKLSAEAAYIQTTTANTEKQKELAEQRNKELLDFEIELAKRLQQLDEEKAAKDLELADRDRAGKANLIEAEYALRRAQGIATFEDDLAVFENARELDRKTLVAHKATNDELEAYDKQTQAGRIQIERATQETKLAIISNALGAVADAVGQNTIAGKALAVAQAGIDTYAGANKALAAYPPPFGAIAAGTVIVAGLMNVRKILSTQLPKIPGAKGMSSAGPAPSMGSIPSIPTPQIQTGQGMNTTEQIAQTIGASQKPIQAYVLSTKVSSQQALDRRTNSAATFS